MYFFISIEIIIINYWILDNISIGIVVKLFVFEIITEIIKKIYYTYSVIHIQTTFQIQKNEFIGTKVYLKCKERNTIVSKK